MARPSHVTPETVAQAAEAILARGESVTNQSVKTFIGSGSMSTIAPLVAAWKSGQNEAAILADVDVPDAVAARIEDLGRVIWKAALAEASVGQDALRRDLVAARTEVETVRAELIGFLRDAEEERDQARDLVQEATEQIEGLQRDLTAMQLENTKLGERLSGKARETIAAETARDEALARLRELQDDLTEARASVRVMIAERDAAARGQDKAEARAERLQGELSAVQTDLGAARSDLTGERAQHAATRSQLSERLERLTVDLEQAEKARDQAMSSNGELRVQVEQVTARLAALEKEKETLSAALEEKTTPSKGQ